MGTLDMRLFTPLGPETFQAQPLLFGAKVEGIDGRWIELNDGETYQLEATCFAERNVTIRSNEVTNALVAGSFATTSLLENVTETVAVWVRGTSAYDQLMNLEALEEAFTQPSYRFLKRTGDASEYWTCLPAGYRVNTQREFAHAGISLFVAQVPRRPQVDRVMTAPDEIL